MGEALAVGLLDGGWEAEELAVAEVDADRHHALEARLPGVRVVRNPAWAAGDAEVLVLAVKPADAVAALASCAEVLPDGALVLSIAAGVTIAALEAVAPGRPVVRAMPNTGALVGRGAAAIAPGQHVTELDLEVCERVLGSVGVVVRVPETPARRGHRPVGLGTRVRVPRRRGDDRGRRARRAPARHERATGAPDHPRRGDAARRRRDDARVVARRGHVARAAPPRPASRCSRRTACAARSSRRSSPRPAAPRSWGRDEPQAAVVAHAAEAARSWRPSGPSAPTTGPNLREQLKQQHVAGRSLRYGRDEVLGTMRRVEHGAPSALCGLPAFPGLTREQVAAAVELDLRLGGRRPARAHRAEPHRRRLHRGGDARARGRARRWAARVRDRAAGRAPAALPSPRRARRGRRAPRCSRARRPSGFGPVRPAGPLDRPRRRAHRRRGAARRRPRRRRRGVALHPRPVPIWSSPTTSTRAWRRRRASRWWRSPTSTRSALAVAAWQGRAVRIVPLDDRRPPAAYAGLLDLLESLASAPIDPFACARDAPPKPARSCSFATRAAEAYAHPAEKRGIRKG